MNSFIKRKKCVGLKILEFSVLGESTNLEICDAIIDITTHLKLHFRFFLKNQIWSFIRVYYGKHFQPVFNRPFYDFDKMAT